jgi:hypothetical protein
MRILALATCLTLPGALALACPVAGDLDKGIRFAVDGVDSEVYRRVGPAMVEAIYYPEGDGTPSRTLLAQGIYLVELSDLVDGAPDPSTRSTYAFPGRAEDLMLPAPGQSVTYDIAISSGGDLSQERQIYDFGQPFTINFGACEYEMYPIEIAYQPDDSGTVDLLYYMPALKISIYVGSDYADGSDRYVYSNIEVVE